VTALPKGEPGEEKKPLLLGEVAAKLTEK